MENLKLVDYTKKRLDEMYLVMHTVKNEINIKKGEIIEPVYIYTIIGINKQGIRELVGIYQDKPSNNRYWLDIFENFKSRGLKTILFLSVDDNKNLKRTAKIAFPMISFVDSLTYFIPIFYKYSSEKDSRRVEGRIQKLFSQKTLEDYKKTFNFFTEIYNNEIHKKLTNKYLKNVEGYYKYSCNIRNLLFKSSANMNVYDRIRLSFNSRKSYINNIDEIYEKLDNIDGLFGFISFTKKEWTLILNDFIKLYPDIDFI